MLRFGKKFLSLHTVKKRNNWYECNSQSVYSIWQDSRQVLLRPSNRKRDALEIRREPGEYRAYVTKTNGENETRGALFRQTGFRKKLCRGVSGHTAYEFLPRICASARHCRVWQACHTQQQDDEAVHFNVTVATGKFWLRPGAKTPQPSTYGSATSLDQTTLSAR